MRKKKYFRSVTIVLKIDDSNNIIIVRFDRFLHRFVLTGKRGGATSYATDVGPNASSNATTTTPIGRREILKNSNLLLSLIPKGICLYCFDCSFSFDCYFNTLALIILSILIRRSRFLDRIQFKCQHLKTRCASFGHFTSSFPHLLHLI